MPLDHKNGEFLAEVGEHARGYAIVPLAKWKATKLYHQAASQAADVYAQESGIRPVGFDPAQVLVQEYQLADKIAFVFCHKVKGDEVFVTYIIDLTPEQVRELTGAGLWKGMVRA